MLYFVLLSKIGMRTESRGQTYRSLLSPLSRVVRILELSISRSSNHYALQRSLVDCAQYESRHSNDVSLMVLGLSSIPMFPTHHRRKLELDNSVDALFENCGTKRGYYTCRSTFGTMK